MNPTNPQLPTSPSTPTPEEDAAIQALENTDTSNGTAEIVTPTPAAPAVATPPSPAPALSSSAAPIVGQDVLPSTAAPTTTAAAAAAAKTEDSPSPTVLSEADPVSTTPAFNPFEAKAAALAKRKKSKKPLIIILVILLLAGLGGGGYYAWTVLQPAPAPSVNTTVPAESEESSLQEPVETPEDVSSEVEAIEADLNAIDESQLQDETISDQTLNQ